MNELKNICYLIKFGFLSKEQLTVRATIFLGFKLFGILIILKAICFGISIFLDSYDIFKIPIKKEEIKVQNKLLKISKIAIIAPIIEELTYRIGLIFSKRNITIALIGLSYFYIKFLIELNKLYSLLIAIIIGIVLLISLNKKIVNSLSIFWKQNRKAVFYGFLLIFSFSHLTNYEITMDLLIFSPIVILKHFTAGIIYSYARFSSGIILAICIHSFNNAIFPLISLILK